MNPLLLSRNGRPLMLILALFLMNVSVAEAKPHWAEGTKGNFAMIALIITTILVGSGMIGAIAYAYRTLVGRRSMPSDEELFNQIRESKEWLAYTAWIRADERPTTYHVERAAAARVLDLERQLFGVPPPSSPLLCGLFSRLFHAVKNGFITSASGHTSVDDNSRRDKGKTPEYRHIPHPKISTADEVGSNPVKNDGKVVTYDSVSAVKSTGLSSEITTHKAKSATTKDGGESSTYDSVSSAKSADSSGTLTAHRTNSATIKDDDINGTHRSRSSNTTADKYHQSPKQYVITPPPHVHTVAKSSKPVEIPIQPAVASRHGYVVPSPSDEFATHPYHQPRRARKPVPIIHHYT